MQGKNRGKTRRSKGTKSKRLEDVSSSDENLSGTPNLLTAISQSVVPRNVGSNRSTIRLADNVEPCMIETVLQCELIPVVRGEVVVFCFDEYLSMTKPVSSTAKRTLFPLETCFLFEKKRSTWLEPLAFDAAFLHAMIFTTQDYYDSILRSKTYTASRKTLPHYLKTVQILRERLLRENDHERLSTSTISAVLALAAHAHFVGDSESAKHHMEGLRRIISLRGGVTSFRENAKLLVEILRYAPALLCLCMN